MSLHITPAPADASELEGVWYAPDVDDNRETRGVVGLIVPMPARLYRHRESATVGRALRGKKAVTPADTIRAGTAWRDESVRLCLRQLRGVTRDGDPARGEPPRVAITDGASFVRWVLDSGNPKLTAWLADFATAIEDESVLMDGRVGESDLPSESTPPSPAPASGAGVALGADGAK